MIAEKTMSSHRELVETALRVLSALVNRRKPAPSEIIVLREAFPTLDDLPDDSLAIKVVQDFGSTAFSTEPGGLGEVA